MDKSNNDSDSFAPESFHGRQLMIEGGAQRKNIDRSSCGYEGVFTVTWGKVSRVFDSSKSLFQQDEADYYGCVNCINRAVTYVRRAPSDDTKYPVDLCVDKHFERLSSVIEISEVPRMQICPFWIERDA